MSASHNEFSSKALQLHEALADGWRWAIRTFREDGLRRPAMLLVPKGSLHPQVFRDDSLAFANARGQIFRTFSNDRVSSAVLVTKAVVGFQASDEAPSSIPDHQAIVLVGLEPGGVAIAQVSRVYHEPPDIYFGEITDLPLPPNLPDVVGRMLSQALPPKTSLH